jgi:hypothetical protein
MKPKFVQLRGSLVSIDHITAIRPSKPDDMVDGEYVITLGIKVMGLGKTEGEALMKWAAQQSVTAQQLAEGAW